MGHTRRESPVTSSTTLTMPPPIGEWDQWQSWSDTVPAAATMLLRCTEVESGHAVMEMNESPWPLNPNGAVHGGLVAAAADHVGGLSAVTVVGAQSLPATATLTAQFLRPALAPLTFDATVLKAGKSVLFVRIDVRDRSGELCTAFTGSWSAQGSRRAVNPAEES